MKRVGIKMKISKSSLMAINGRPMYLKNRYNVYLHTGATIKHPFNHGGSGKCKCHKCKNYKKSGQYKRKQFKRQWKNGVNWEI